MKKNPIAMVCLMIALALTSFSTTGIAQEKNESEIHHYLDISFETTTPDEIPKILQEKTGSILTDEYGMYKITDFGYEFDMQVDFNENDVGVNRITLHRAGSGWRTETEFGGLVEHDILQFIDMEAQITTQYGEPDYRFFYTDGAKYNQSGFSKFMFVDGKWNAAQMMKVCENDKYLVAYSTWGNAVLRVWVDWKNKGEYGYLSQLDLHFDNEVFSTQKSIAEYPPENDN